MMTRKLQVLLVAFVCTVLFSAVAFADREDPRANSTKDPRQHQTRLNRAGKTIGKWTPLKQGVSTPFGDTTNSCGGWCNCTTCYCEYDSGDLGCCFSGCDFCWFELDTGNNYACFAQ